MGESGPEMLAMQTSSTKHSPVFSAFKEHCSSPRTNTQLAVLESIRSIHADKHVTVVSASGCDLIEFALAGHAKASLITKDQSYMLQRIYKAPPGRSRNGEGKLLDHVMLGQYDYAWKGHSFPVYRFEWNDAMCGSVRNYYILSAKEHADEQGHEATADALIAACSKYTGELHEEIYVFDSGHWYKNHGLWEAVQSSNWDDVILDQAMKQTLIDDVHGFFDSREVYQEYSVPWKRGIIFHGTPGCGKTISIKALMKSLQAKDVASLYVKSLESRQGPQQSIRAIFSQARLMAPCLLVLEDLDSLVKDEVRSYFLNEVDGLEDNDGILMIGSTNHLSRLDPGIAKRPSRFDRKYHYQLPGETERILYAQYWQRKLAANKNIDFPNELCNVVSDMTEGFSFAYMKELFVQALLAIVGGRTGADDDEDVVKNVAEKSTVDEQGGSAALLKEGESMASTASTDEEPSAPRRKITDLEVPTHLQSNAFLRILRKQVTVLIREMDNTDDGKTARPKIPGLDGKDAMRANVLAMRAQRVVPIVR